MGSPGVADKAHSRRKRYLTSLAVSRQRKSLGFATISCEDFDFPTEEQCGSEKSASCVSCTKVPQTAIRTGDGDHGNGVG